MLPSKKGKNILLVSRGSIADFLCKNVEQKIAKFLSLIKLLKILRKISQKQRRDIHVVFLGSLSQHFSLL